MRKISAFLIIIMMFFNLWPMKIKPLKTLAADCYIKNAEFQLLKTKNNSELYKKQCDGIMNQLLDLLSDIGFELSLRFLYTTKNFPVLAMKLLANQLNLNAKNHKELAYEQLFMQLYNYISSPPQFLMDLPLIEHKALFVKALQQKDITLAESLLENGARPNGTVGVDTFLAFAVKLDAYNIVEALVKYGADANPKYGTHPLYYAALDENERMIRLLLTKDSLPNFKYLAGASHSVFERLVFLRDTASFKTHDKYVRAIKLLNQINHSLNVHEASMPFFHDVPLNQ